MAATVGEEKLVPETLPILFIIRFSPGAHISGLLTFAEGSANDEKSLDS